MRLRPFLPRLIGVAVALLPIALHTDTARACGASGPGVSALLPLDGATNVPLNAVLQASSFDSSASFELKQAVDGSAVEVAVVCHKYRGFVCVASPVELRPQTTYSWLAVTDTDPAVHSAEYTFTTGDSLQTAPMELNSSELNVLGVFQQPAADCNATRRLELSLALSVSTLPVVLTVDDALPMHIEHAVTVTESSPFELRLFDPPDCFTVRLTNAVGESITLPQTCIASDQEQAPDAGDSQPITQDAAATIRPTDAGVAEPEEQGSSTPSEERLRNPAREGCAISPQSTLNGRGSLVALGILITALFGWRRSRRSVRHGDHLAL